MVWIPLPYRMGGGPWKATSACDLDGDSEFAAWSATPLGRMEADRRGRRVPVPPRSFSHSARRALSGSIRDARKAGTELAASATQLSSMAIPT
jgi:hypothetical protein